MNGKKARQLRRENPQPKKAKVPTPPSERSYVTGFVPGAASTRKENTPQPRSQKKVDAFLKRFTPSTSSK
jgi:hypothetical protein